MAEIKTNYDKPEHVAAFNLLAALRSLVKGRTKKLSIKNRIKISYIALMLSETISDDLVKMILACIKMDLEDTPKYLGVLQVYYLIRDYTSKEKLVVITPELKEIGNGNAFDKKMLDAWSQAIRDKAFEYKKSWKNS